MINELRKVPKKNYLFLGIIIVITLLILYYFYMWIDVYNDSKLNESILDSYMDKINYNELEDFLVENSDSIIYVSVLEDEEIRRFEKKFKNLFKDNKLKNDLLYLDITEDIKDTKKVSEMKKKYSVNTISMVDTPLIMVFDEGKLKDIYKINVKEYNLLEIEEFINNISFEDGDMND